MSSKKKSDLTRERILTSARNAFSRKGFSGVTINDITGPADVTRATFYYYYADKTQLFIELGTETYLEVLAVVESFSDIGSPATRREIDSWIDRYFHYLDRNGAFVIRSSDDAPPDRRFRSASARAHRRTAQALGERIAKIAVTAPESDSHAMGLVVMAALERTWLLTQGDDGAKAALAELIVRLLA